MANFTPGPWHVDAGTIRDSNGDALGSYPYSFAMADMTDRNNGVLMAAAPELLDACSLAIRTIYDVLRHYEANTASNKETLEEIAADLQKLTAKHYQATHD